MKNIIFVCHGNICRSVMAEYIFDYYNKNENITSSSRATSYEEIGNDIYYQAKIELEKHHIPYSFHQAQRITKAEYDQAYKVYVMDQENYNSLKMMFNDTRKVEYLNGYIEDPWYTRRFGLVFDEIKEGVLRVIREIEGEQL